MGDKDLRNDTTNFTVSFPPVIMYCLQIPFVLFASHLGVSHSLRRKKFQRAVEHLPSLWYDMQDTVIYVP
jgi:hypothetical protein